MALSTPFAGIIPNTAPQNGRVNFSGPESAGGTVAQLPGFSHQRTAEQNFQGDMLRGNWEKNNLSDVFFSQQNVQIVQNLIRKDVYERSGSKGYVIDDQSVDELKIIMRAMYYQYSRNLPYDIAGQVAELNQRVVDWSAPHIMSAVDHYYYYIKDIESMPVPLTHPVNISRAGTRTKPLGQFM
jgi:hypothetical protein